jgi:hypothetical protein
MRGYHVAAWNTDSNSQPGPLSLNQPSWLTDACAIPLFFAEAQDNH